MKNLTWILLVLSIPGCVSMGKFKKMMADRDDLKSKLEATGAKAEDLEKANQSLNKDMETLTANREALAKDKEALLAEREALAGEKEALEKQNAELLKAQADAKAQYDAALGSLQQEVQSGNLKLTQYKNMLSVDVAEQLFFNSGSADLKPAGMEVLMKVSKVLNEYPDKYIRVSGHTDNVPLGRNAPFASNWELSVARATNVVRFMQEKGDVDGKRLVAAGRASYDPVADNSSKEGRQKNRRIEIVLMDKALFESTQPSSQPGAQPQGATETAK